MGIIWLYEQGNVEKSFTLLSLAIIVLINTIIHLLWCLSTGEYNAAGVLARKQETPKVYYFGVVFDAIVSFLAFISTLVFLGKWLM